MPQDYRIPDQLVRRESSHDSQTGAAMSSLPLVFLVESIGLFAVGLCFMFLLPGVGAFLVTVFSAILGEQTYARLKGIESGSNMHLDD